MNNLLPVLIVSIVTNIILFGCVVAIDIKNKHLRDKIKFLKTSRKNITSMLDNAVSLSIQIYKCILDDVPLDKKVVAGYIQRLSRTKENNIEVWLEEE